MQGTPTHRTSSCSTPAAPMAYPAVSRVTTPLNTAVWRAALDGHPDPQFTGYILPGIEHSFQVGFARPRLLSATTNNCPSARAHPEVMTHYVEKEVALGRFLGPVTSAALPELHLSKFGVIPKGHTHGRWRLITDLSAPKGQSINNGIDLPLCSLRYVTVDEIAVLPPEVEVADGWHSAC